MNAISVQIIYKIYQFIDWKNTKDFLQYNEDLYYDFYELQRTIYVPIKNNFILKWSFFK